MAQLAVATTCKRDRSRLKYLAAVKITNSDGLSLRGNLRDIGINSLFMKTEKIPEEDLGATSVEVAIIVKRRESSLTIETPGEIIRVDDDGLAIKFAEPLSWWPIFSLFPVNERFMFDIVSST